MNWSVTYRTKEGGQVVDVFEAESREALFKQLADKGITAIRVQEGQARTKRSTSARRPRPFPRAVAWACAGLVAAVSVFLVTYYILPVDKSVTETRSATTTRPAKTSPSLPSNSIDISQPEAKPLPKYKTKEEQYYAETNGLSKAMMAKWRFEHRAPAAWTNDSSKVEQPEYATFDFQSEKEIICLLTVEPGDMLLGDGNYGPEFERDFLKSLAQPIIVSKDDTPEQAEWKRMMIETKIDLKARMDAGESISEIMRATRREYQRLAEMKEFIKDEIRSMRNAEGVTVQDVDTCIEAANRMLESKGVSKLKISPLMRKALIRKCVDYNPEVLERK